MYERFVPMETKRKKTLDAAVPKKLHDSRQYCDYYNDN